MELLAYESAFGALNSILNLDDFIQLITINPRKRFNIEVPEIKVGKKAEITLFNPEGVYQFEEKNILSTSKNSIFINKKLKGKAYGVFSNNQLILNS